MYVYLVILLMALSCTIGLVASGRRRVVRFCYATLFFTHLCAAATLYIAPRVALRASHAQHETVESFPSKAGPIDSGSAFHAYRAMALALLPLIVLPGIAAFLFAARALPPASGERGID